jgi:hypothetical protein
MLHQPLKKQLPISTLLGLLGSFFLLACLLWMPSFLASALEDHELKHYAVAATGKVVGHRSWVRRDTNYYSASVEYAVEGKSFIVVVQGVGASEQRLPLGTTIEVRHLVNRPNVAEASATDASTFRPSLLLVACICGIPVLLLLGAYLSRQKGPRTLRNAA